MSSMCYLLEGCVGCHVLEKRFLLRLSDKVEVEGVLTSGPTTAVYVGTVVQRRIKPGKGKE